MNTITTRKADRRATERLKAVIRTIDAEYCTVKQVPKHDRRAKGFTFLHFEILNEGKQ